MRHPPFSTATKWDPRLLGRARAKREFDANGNGGIGGVSPRNRTVPSWSSARRFAQVSLRHKIGAPREIRTPGPAVRSRVLSSAELWGLDMAHSAGLEPAKCPPRMRVPVLSASSAKWRSGRDSNGPYGPQCPRVGFPAICLAGSALSPLRHRSLIFYGCGSGFPGHTCIVFSCTPSRNDNGGT